MRVFVRSEEKGGRFSVNFSFPLKMLPHALCVFGESQNTKSMWRELAPLTASRFLESLKTPKACVGKLPPDCPGVLGSSKKHEKARESPQKLQSQLECEFL